MGLLVMYGRARKNSTHRPTQRIHRRAAWFLLLPLVGQAVGCQTISTLTILPPYLAILGIQNAALDAVVTPRATADAGPTQLTVVSQRVVLDGSNSGVVLGTGTRNTAPSPALTFAWQITASPVTDRNGDGIVNAADFTAAGVRLDFANTVHPQFSSPVAGDYTIQLTVSWTGPLGAQTSTATTTVSVFATAP